MKCAPEGATRRVWFYRMSANAPPRRKCYAHPQTKDEARAYLARQFKRVPSAIWGGNF